MSIPTGALVLYKSRPAKVCATGDKIAIRTEGGADKKVRDKDVLLLHPGPFAGFGELASRDGEVEEAWEMLEGESVALAELADLVFGEFTPSSAWATWALLAEGVYFQGEPDRIRPRSGEEVQAIREAREAKARAEREWRALIDRIHAGRFREGDEKPLSEIERLAYGDIKTSRLMKALKRPETREGAHALLLKLGYWDEMTNPQARRRKLPLADPDLPIAPLREEERQDLTHLPAYAIDDAGSTDPDDAISVDGDRLWVHVADVAALVAPDDEVDLEARGRGANLYLPEGTVHMLPPAVTERLALGLQEISPALSFGMRLDDEGNVRDVRVTPSRVKVTRVTYEEADEALSTPSYAEIKAFTDRFRAKRRRRGSARLRLPEVKIRVRDGGIDIKALPDLQSREMVADAMLMAGEGVARYALEHHLSIAFSTQNPPEQPREPKTLSQMFAYRKAFRPSQLRSVPGPHFGLGLEVYSQVTSPLRRYLDLVAHQQLRAHLRGERGIPGDGLLDRVGAAEAVGGINRKAERESNLHWKLAWLIRHPGWRGEGIAVDRRGRKTLFSIPELALEVSVGVQNVALDASLTLECTGVDLANLTARFRVV